MIALKITTVLIIVGSLIMALGLVPPPLLYEFEVIDSTRFNQASNIGYFVAAVGAALLIIGVVVAVFEQAAHTSEHEATAPKRE